MSSSSGRGADTSVGEAASRDPFQLNLPRDCRFGFSPETGDPARLLAQVAGRWALIKLKSVR
jgi:hypothetical protein